MWHQVIEDVNRKEEKKIMNVVMLTGKILKFSDLKVNEDGRTYLEVVLECMQDVDNSYIYNNIVVSIFDGMVGEVISKCKVGEDLAIQGYIKTYSTKMNNETYYNYEIIVEYVTSLSLFKIV